MNDKIVENEERVNEFLDWVMGDRDCFQLHHTFSIGEEKELIKGKVN